MNNVSIQGDPRYINYRFDVFTFPVLFACIPLFYLVPTIWVISKIVSVYASQLVTKREDGLNPHVFSVIVMAQISNFFFMLSDYFTIRLPSTGLMTSWCASQQPNHFLTLLFFCSVYFNYVSMLFPFLISVLRMVPLYFPGRQKELCSKIVRFCAPLIYFYPILFSFFLFPALGFCRQLLGPYQFGAIYIFFSGSWHDLKLANLLAFNVVFWLFLSFSSNVVLYRKLKRLRNNRKSLRLQRAELSISLTSFSMLISYVTNLVFIIFFIIYPPWSTYFIAFRPFGNDCETVFVPCIFYLTHPTFRKKKKIVSTFRSSQPIHTI